MDHAARGWGRADHDRHALSQLRRGRRATSMGGASMSFTPPGDEQGGTFGRPPPTAPPAPPVPGWWLASDGNCYPPQAAPGVAGAPGGPTLPAPSGARAPAYGPPPAA